ncbi:MAG: FAD-dependent monooxygenase [Alphaproteobacteria bacterium]|jgi:2-polyprenyl-6-methoxyphenol hydroxylase-like FAD-dependent oxidoreductase|nr:FAD-dependent monooxygenase [Alphaproteobacteria bacterium]
MRVLVVGGGPAGLYFAGLLKRSNPSHEVTILERNPPGATYGFGVVFPEAALGYLGDADGPSHARIVQALETWRDLTIVHRDRAVTIDGNGFSGIARLELLRLLAAFCEEAGVVVRHGAEARAEDLEGYDLVVGADGINSMVRELGAATFWPRIETLTNWFIWYGTRRVFDTLTLTFRANNDGHFVAHHYRYTPEMSTFIVECDAETYDAAGFAGMSEVDSQAYCQRVFAGDLGDNTLTSNNSTWRQFPVTSVENWIDGNRVLIGDALRSVHFSIGSGTRLALEDAIALWRALVEFPNDVGDALRAFEAARRPVVEKLLNAAAGSYGWYENIAEHMRLGPFDLAYDYMTRSGRVDEARLRNIAPRFMDDYDRSRLAG